MNIFLCLTPYHVLLSYLSDEFGPADRIVFLDEKSIGREALPLARNCPDLFYYISLTPGRWGSLKHFSKISTYGRVARRIRGLANRRYEKVFFFNDRSPASQYFLSICQPVEFIYVEDGSAAYRCHAFSTNILKKWALALSLDFRYRQVTAMGGSGYAEKAKFLYPTKAVYPKNLEPGQYEVRSNIIRYAGHLHDKQASITGGSSTKAKVLVLLPYRYPESVTRAKWDEFITALAQELADTEIFIKGHPLAAGIMPEHETDIVPISRSVPAELLVILNKFEEVFVEPSTAIHSLQFFAADTQVTAVLHSEQGFFHERESFLDTFNIKKTRVID